MKKLSKSIQRQRDELQAAYDRMNAPATQRVRNPIPFRAAVRLIIPPMVDPDEQVKVKTTVVRSALGKRLTTHETETVLARFMLGGDKYVRQVQRRAMSVDDIIAKLRRLGFVVRSRSSVAQHLRGFDIGAVDEPASATEKRQRNKGELRGRPRRRYYLRDKSLC